VHPLEEVPPAHRSVDETVVEEQNGEALYRNIDDLGGYGGSASDNLSDADTVGGLLLNQTQGRDERATTKGR
jgi:hypothetical protein